MKSNNNSSKLSPTFIFLKRMGLIGDSHKYGQISVWGVLGLVVKTFFRRLIFTYSYKGYILEPVNKKMIRPLFWKWLGCRVGKNVNIGHEVRLDFGNANLISIGDDVVISNGATILCHKRDVSNYRKQTKATDLPFIYEGVTLERGCQIGLNVTILPGVTIGEGAIIGSCAIVTKNIPAWSVAVGCPAKVVRRID